jgi:hypothetical protein
MIRADARRTFPPEDSAMPFRLCLALAAACLVPAVGECAAPFVSSSDPILPPVGPAVSAELHNDELTVPDLVWSGPFSWSNLARFSIRPTRHRLPFFTGTAIVDVSHEPPFFPIHDDGSNSLWAYPFGKNPPESSSGSPVRLGAACLGDLDILHPPEIPTTLLQSRHLNLHLETSGIGKWHTALVDVWITRDGWNWHLFQQSLQTDSLVVDLPEQGRYGLRLVVHDMDALASPVPRVGELPQLWVEVDEDFLSPGLPVRSFLDGRYESCLRGTLL